MVSFPELRLRRLRDQRQLRTLTQETRLSASHFIYPMFVTHGQGQRQPIEPMPGCHQLSLDSRAALELGVDVATFTSSSTVRNLNKMLDGDWAALESSTIACIGPATEATAKELGLRVDLVADDHSVQGLVDALVDHFSTEERATHG